MESQEGKDYFGYSGQAQSYAKYRPQYPSAFLKLLVDDTLPNIKKDLCVDLATGTGFLVHHFATEMGFNKVIGIDVSESQLKEAALKYKDLINVEFKKSGVDELPQFLEQEGLQGKVDLFTFGQALHWFNPDKTLKIINSQLKDENQNLIVLGYARPIIYDGSNWEQKIEAEQMEEKGYEIIKIIPEGYKFQKDSSVQTPISEAYEDMWAKSYPHFKCDRPAIEKFFYPFNFSSNLKVIRKVIWYDVTPDKSIHEVLGYMNSVSGYQCYMDEMKIEKGSDQDLWVILKNKIIKSVGEGQNPNDIKVDFVTPYFAIVCGKKDE